MQQFLTRVKESQPTSTIAIVKEYQSLYLKSQGLDQDEISKLYKTQAQTSTRLLELLDTVKESQDALNSAQLENENLKTQIKVLNCKLVDSNENIKEKEGVVQILQDELSAHQLELVHKEGIIRNLQEKIKDLETENQELVNRVVEIKEIQAQSINEANESRWGFGKIGVQRKSSKEECFKFPGCSVPNQLAKKVSYHESDINCISVSKDGDFIATGSNDKNIVIINAKTGTKLSVLTGALQGIMFTDFLGGELVLGASNDQAIRIWQLSSQRLKTSLTGHVGKVYSARFIQESTVISGSHDRTIKIWDLNKGYCVKTIFSLSSCNDLTAANLDGSVIISGHLDNNIRLWDSRSGNQIREIIGNHSAQITGVQMFPDLTKFLTTSRDNTLKIFDVRTYEPLLTIT